MSSIAERVEKRIRAEWPGLVFTRNGEPYVAPEVREGGATDAFIRFVAAIIEQEAAEVEEKAWQYDELCD